MALRHRLSFESSNDSFDQLVGRDHSLLAVARPRRSRMLFNSEKFSLIRAIPHTGRTHQIRVHLSSIGHPIVGDKIYGPDEELYLHFIETGWTLELERQLLLRRPALPSARLAIQAEREGPSPWPIY